jgi:hypothetical protein
VVSGIAVKSFPNPKKEKCKMKSFLAMITPVVSGAHPDHELPKPQPPTGAPPHPDHTLPGDLPHPEHPIYYPLPPGAPVDPDYGVPDTHPDQGLPGPQPHPEHPIVLPPDLGNWKPVYIWGGPGSLPTAPHPDHDLPIPVPPDQPVTGPGGGTISFRPIWTPENGWQVIGIVQPGGPHPTPSKK